MKTTTCTLVTVLFILCITACTSILGIRPMGEAPKKAGKYPKFKEADYLRGTITPEREVYDVRHYTIQVSLFPKQIKLEGLVEMTSVALQDFSRLQIDLHKNMDILSLQYAGQELKYERKANAVYVDFPQPIRKGSLFTLTTKYEGKPMVAAKPPWAGGFVWKYDDDGNPWIGVACEGDGSSLWWPGKDHLYDEPDSMDMFITVPQNLVAVSNGRLRSKKASAESETTTWHWHTSYPINNYNITLYAGNFRHFEIAYNDTFNLDFYVLPDKLEDAREHFKQAVPIIRYFEQAFGAYPWPKDGYKLVQSPFAGMEHQSAIAYGSGFGGISFMGLSNPGARDYIILHETAHEWWGNSVTARDFADIWIHEGMATYAEAMYVEHTEGKKAYYEYVMRQMPYIKNKRPVVGPTGVSYFNYKDSDPYIKGAATMHTLRGLLDNDSLFFSIIRGFYQKYQHSIATTQDFIDFANEKTGQDLTWFFRQYLYDRLPPKLEYSYSYDSVAQNGTLRYRWADVQPEFKMPVTVTLGLSEEETDITSVFVSTATPDKSAEEMKTDVLYPKTEWQTKTYSNIPAISIGRREMYFGLENVGLEQ